MKKNIFDRIKFEKIVVVMNVGGDKERLKLAEEKLGEICNQKLKENISKTSSKDLGIKKGNCIGYRVTMRGEKGINLHHKNFIVAQLYSVL